MGWFVDSDGVWRRGKVLERVGGGEVKGWVGFLRWDGGRRRRLISGAGEVRRHFFPPCLEGLNSFPLDTSWMNLTRVKG